MPKENGQLGLGQPGQGRATTFRECDLKICELCGWLNLDSNDECFVCGWHGRFERDSRAVHAALELALREHGRIEIQHLTDVCTYHKPPERNLICRLAACARTLFKRFRRSP